MAVIKISDAKSQITPIIKITIGRQSTFIKVKSTEKIYNKVRPRQGVGSMGLRSFKIRTLERFSQKPQSVVCNQLTINHNFIRLKKWSKTKI